MLLKELCVKYSDYQMVLSFSNNDDVVITKSDFEPNSKFLRRSRKRLSEEFKFCGYIHDVDIISDKIAEDDIVVYRTYREGSDYILYIYSNYKVLESVRKKLSYQKIIKRTKNTLEPAAPAPDMILDIYPYIQNNTNKYCVGCRHDKLGNTRNNLTCSRVYTHSMPYDYLGYYKATLLGLVIAKKYPELIQEVRVNIDNDYYFQGVGKFITGEWTNPDNVYIQDYIRNFDILRKELQDMGISIRFVYKS